MPSLSVDLGERSYPIHIQPGLLARGDLLRAHVRGKQVCVVTNTTVASLYLARLRTALEGFDVTVVELPEGEAHKGLEAVARIYDELLAAGHHRSTTLLALGGGVVGDICGFAAATYQRGIDFIQCPTTLLAQVDSSVGGKTGVNHPRGKNMIGAFHQPRLVLADIDALTTLPRREFAAGLAEVIKYGLIADRAFFHWLESNLDALMAQDAAALNYAVERSCAIKAEVVARDERESGVRAWLNLGHTFGHAIEAAQGYGEWLHGEAVAAGMAMAADLSRRLGWLPAGDVARLENLLSRAGLPRRAPPIERDRFLSLMAADKKVRDGRIRLVLLRQIGEAVITAETPDSLLIETLSHCRAPA